MRITFLIVPILIITLCALSISAGIIGEPTPRRRKVQPLRGLPGVSVIVILSRSFVQLREYGFEEIERTIKTEIEAILRKKGVKVFTPNESALTPSRPVLNIRIVAEVHEGANLAAISALFVLQEDVVISRANLLEVRAATAAWRSLSFVDLNEPQDTKAFHEDISAVTNRFTKAYFEHNPDLIRR